MKWPKGYSSFCVQKAYVCPSYSLASSFGSGLNRFRWDYSFGQGDTSLFKQGRRPFRGDDTSKENGGAGKFRIGTSLDGSPFFSKTEDTSAPSSQLSPFLNAVKNPGKIDLFLDKHPSIGIELIKRTIREIPRFFDKPFTTSLTVKSDPEESGVDQLFLFVQPDMEVPEAVRAHDKFMEEWELPLAEKNPEAFSLFHVSLEFK